MKTLSIPTYLGIPVTFELGDTIKRGFAFCLDFVIKWLYFIGTLLLTYRTVDEEPIVFLLIQLPFLTYSLLFEWLLKGQTPGKKIMKLRVVSYDGTLPSFLQCATRWAFNLVDVWSLLLLAFINEYFIAVAIFSPLVGYILIVKNSGHQRFGDMAANTFVVSVVEPEIGLEDTVYAYADSRHSYVVSFPEVMRLSDADLNKIKYYTEAASHADEDVIAFLSRRIKELLGIETDLPDRAFLQKLLADYNYIAKDVQSV